MENINKNNIKKRFYSDFHDGAKRCSNPSPAFGSNFNFSVLKIICMKKTVTNIKKKPVSITMWEFSWIERNWPGAGYEDWNLALSQLKERGYNSIRIDAFPHLIYKNPNLEYLIYPHWNTQDWGSPAINKVTLHPKLTDFIKLCKNYDIKIALSTWWRKDEHESYKIINTPEKLAKVWLSVLDLIDKHGLMDQVLYVDLSNEWPLEAWTPFASDIGWWDSKESAKWMQTSINILRHTYPQLPYTFSFTGEITKETIAKGDLSMLDFLEPHIWMVHSNNNEFYKLVNYNYELFSNDGYHNVALKAEKLYRKNESYWKELLLKQIDYAAEWSKVLNKPIVTTECWGIVDYKDWPLLQWDWVKELCELGTIEAAKTGRWAAIATSNFCGPQFKGMWRDIKWHKKLTKEINAAVISGDLLKNRLSQRL